MYSPLDLSAPSSVSRSCSFFHIRVAPSLNTVSVFRALLASPSPLSPPSPPLLPWIEKDAPTHDPICKSDQPTNRFRCRVSGPRIPLCRSFTLSSVWAHRRWPSPISRPRERRDARERARAEREVKAHVRSFRLLPKHKEPSGRFSPLMLSFQGNQSASSGWSQACAEEQRTFLRFFSSSPGLR